MVRLERQNATVASEPLVTSRDRICSGLDLAQTEKTLCWRVILDNMAHYETTSMQPLNKLWGLDVSEYYIRLFIRGDPQNPVLFGKLAGKCIPHESLMEFTKDEMAAPCIKVTISKATDGNWGDDPIDWGDDPLGRSDRSGLTPFSLRDFCMNPASGTHRSIHWVHFMSTLRLRISLPKGSDFRRVTESDFDVQLNDRRKLIIKCCNSKLRGFATIRAELRHDANPRGSFIFLDDGSQDHTADRTLCIEILKMDADEWEDGIFMDQLTSPSMLSPDRGFRFQHTEQPPLFGWTMLEPACDAGVEVFSWQKEGDWTVDQKARADVAFRSGDFKVAADLYSRVLRCIPSCEKLLSNRSASYIRLGEFRLALHDATRAQELSPDWPKVYLRMGQALRGLRRSEQAIAIFHKGKICDMVEASIWDHEIKTTKIAIASNAAKKGQWI